MKHLSKNGKTVTLNKFLSLEKPRRERSADDKLGLILDVETTGLSCTHDRVIQLAFRPFYVNSTSFEVTGIAKKTVILNDPGEPLREEITRLTGLSDKDLSGHSIDWEWVKGALERPDFIICHNAKFDRGFVENEIARAGLSHSEGAVWCCSINEIDWLSFCRPSKALEVLCAWSGFFYDSHDAGNDIDALLHLLRKEKRLKELFENGSNPEQRVFAVNFPRDQNHELKRRWYKWDPSVNMWWKGFKNKVDANSELSWMAENFNIEPQIFELDPKYRYSPD
jgi:DNA polymerase-3 subunit epsilon